MLIGVALFEERGNQGVGFVLDLTVRKRAEAEARESERRYRETLTQLAHANRVEPWDNSRPPSPMKSGNRFLQSK